LAELYESIGNFEAAAQRFDELADADPLYVDALLGSARLMIRRGAPADAINALTRALSLAVRLESLAPQASAHQALGVTYKLLNRPAEALISYQQALELRTRLGLKSAVGASLNEIAQVHDMMGHRVEAERAYLESLKVRREVGDRAGEAGALINLSSFYQEAGDPKRSLPMINDALAVARELGNEDQESLCLNLIGVTQMDLGDLQTATAFFERSLAIRRRLNLQAVLGDTLHNLAVVAEREGDFAKAARLVAEAIEQRRRVKQERGQAYATYELGVILRQQGLFLASANATRDAESLVRAGDPWHVEILARGVASRAMLGDCDRIADAVAKPVQLAKADSRPRLLSSVLQAQGDALMSCGDLTAATAATEEAVAAAAPTNSPVSLLAARVQLAQMRNAAGRAADAMSIASQVAAEARRLKLDPIATGALLELAEAQLAQRKHRDARQSATAALAFADKTKSWPHLARANHALGRALAGLGENGESAKRLAEAKQWVEQIRKEAGTDAVLKGADLARIVSQ
jgi:tetratricopeptide (TPR) repeat protein